MTLLVDVCGKVQEKLTDLFISHSGSHVKWSVVQSFNVLTRYEENALDNLQTKCEQRELKSFLSNVLKWCSLVYDCFPEPRKNEQEVQKVLEPFH